MMAVMRIPVIGLKKVSFMLKWYILRQKSEFRILALHGLVLFQNTFGGRLGTYFLGGLTFGKG